MSQATTQKTFTKLYIENSNESWAAMENLLFSKPANMSLAGKEISLEKAIKKKISVDFLQKLIKHKANVNEVISLSGYLPSNPLKRAISLKLHDHAALLISRGALDVVDSKPSKLSLPPIIVATKLVIKQEGINRQFFSSLFCKSLKMPRCFNSYMLP